MTSASKSGASKLLPKCTLPLTCAGCIHKVVADLAYVEINDGKFWLKERAPGVSVDEIVAMHGGNAAGPSEPGLEA